MHTAGDYLVYSCPSCDKRVFTQRRFQGRHGDCPLCGHEHLVGGAPDVLVNDEPTDSITVAEEAPDRRGAARVTPKHSRGVEVRAARQTGRPLGRDQIEPIVDISATGLGFVTTGTRDSRSLTGWKPPNFNLGDALALTLHSSKIHVRARAVRAIVRRVEPGKKRGLWHIGVEFMGLEPEDEAFLAELLEG